MNRVKGKTAIVTGAGSGIGESAAKLLAAEGAGVAVIDIDDENGQRVVSEISRDGGSAVYRHMDISHEDEVKNTFTALFELFGRLDILVNNAAVAVNGKPTHELKAEEWDQVMNVNMRGTFLCTKYAIPFLMRSGKGSVINISSIMGIKGGPAVAYNTSKAGIRHMTKNDALIYAKYNIRFNSVHPGYIITPLFRKLASKSALGVEGSIQAEGKQIPLGRMGSSEEIASGILFLASDESSYITGSELVIDGGKLVS
jgi:NAD(P)-dependent dehydrogenase (short-subunit alcohol dehydrogenase family)